MSMMRIDLGECVRGSCGKAYANKRYNIVTGS